jgi:hypothetical protein
MQILRAVYPERSERAQNDRLSSECSEESQKLRGFGDPRRTAEIIR